MTDIDKRLDKIEQQLQTIANHQVPVIPANAGIHGGAAISRDDEIDLRELWNILWQGKLWIISITFLFAVTGVIYAFSLPNTYKSEVLLAPAGDETSTEGGMSGALGGLAGLAGLNVRSVDKTVMAVEVLKSREFFEYFLNKRNILVPLVASEGFDPVSLNLLVDSSIYDKQNELWLGEGEPTVQQAYRVFNNLFVVEKNKKTGFVTLSLEFYSPRMAAEWLSWIVEDINLIMKKRDVAEAKQSVKYLISQVEKTSLHDLRSVFYQLIEEQTKIIMFAEVRDEYVFKTIDRAIAPEEKVSPRRMLIVFVAVFLGGIISLALVLVRVLLFRSRMV